MKIREIMNKELIYLDTNSRLEDAMRAFSHHDVDGLLLKIQEEDQVRVMTKRDLFVALLEGKERRDMAVDYCNKTYGILYDDMVISEVNPTFFINLIYERKTQKLVGLAKAKELNYMKDLNRLSFELESIIESSYDGIYIADGEANTIKINKSYERITGLNREELIGKNMAQLVKDKVLSESVTLLVIKKKAVTTIQQQFKTGKKALVTGTPIFDNYGNVVMVVTNVRDITELSDLRTQLDQNKALARKYYSTIEELKMQLSQHEHMIAEDEKNIKVLEMAKRIAKVDTTVLILGETGVGKEEIAKLIHRNSLRKDKPYVKINCGAIPANLIESELFGYEKGAFTGASKDGKLGLFEVAEGGTLLLDEVGELSLDMQVKLLRVLQEGEIKRIGGNQPIKVDVRILAATNKDLEEMVSEGTFREDLFYRLNVIPIQVPPLRERKKDIMPLAYRFLETFNQRYHMNKTLSFSANACLLNHNWPGNVRELKNIVERVVVTSQNNEITGEDLPEKIKCKKLTNPWEMASDIMPLKEAVEAVESQLIENAFKKHGNVRAAAKALGIDASTFVRKRQKFNK